LLIEVIECTSEMGSTGVMFCTIPGDDKDNDTMTHASSPLFN